MNIIELADILDVQIEITYYPNQQGRFCACFKGCEIKDDGALAALHGNGKTPYAAIDAYSAEIAGETLVFNAHENNRREFKCPAVLEDLA